MDRETPSPTGVEKGQLAGSDLSLCLFHENPDACYLAPFCSISARYAVGVFGPSRGHFNNCDGPRDRRWSKHEDCLRCCVSPRAVTVGSRGDGASAWHSRALLLCGQQETSRGRSDLRVKTSFKIARRLDHGDSMGIPPLLQLS